jgi:hypothetical protein
MFPNRDNFFLHQIVPKQVKANSQHLKSLVLDGASLADEDKLKCFTQVSDPGIHLPKPSQSTRQNKAQECWSHVLPYFPKMSCLGGEDRVVSPG